jgi:redox-sensitive bicupin YhaK (pirin superfamily)
MSAGSGLRHSEFNGSAEEWVKLLQIWIITAERNVPPRYDQRSFDPAVRQGNWQVLVHPKDAGWFVDPPAGLDQQNPDGTRQTFTIHCINRKWVYFFNISGSANIADTVLQERDALGLEGTEKLRSKC